MISFDVQYINDTKITIIIKYKKRLKETVNLTK